MRKLGIIGVLSMLLVAFSASAALAVVNFENAPQGAHFAQGFGEPVCTANEAGTAVTCTETQIEGVGHTNATVNLAITATVTGVCHNPGVNSKIVEPFTRTVTSSTSTELTSTKNGRLIVPAQTTTAPTEEDFLESFTCPNPNWTPEVTDIEITGFTYTLTFEGETAPAISITGTL